MIETIIGNLLGANEKYIVHQTNCISTIGAAGIAKDIFYKYPYADCYISRTKTSKPGSIDIRGNGLNQRLIVNLHGQVYPGRCRYPLSSLDGLAAREKYFYHGLLLLAKIEKLESIAFPWKVGCGLAGGDWKRYFGTITNFALHIKEKQNAKTVIYRLEGDENN